MCLIIYNASGNAYTKDQIANAYDTNDDGVGIMWIEDGEVQVLKGLYSKEDTLQLMEGFVGVPHVIHFRMATHGGVKPELAHPFRASHDDADDHVWLMHNGVMSGMGEGTGESDTSAFARQLRQTCEDMGTTDCLFEEYHRETIEEYVGLGQKIIFLRGDGEITILNRKAWSEDEEDDTLLYSNTYSIHPRHYYTSNSSRGVSNYSYPYGASFPYGGPGFELDDVDDDDEIDWFTWDDEGNYIPCDEDVGMFALMEDGTVVSVFEEDDSVEVEVPTADILREALAEGLISNDGGNHTQEKPGDTVYVRTEDGGFESIGQWIPADIDEYFLWDGDAMITMGLPVRQPNESAPPAGVNLLLPRELKD